MSAARRPPSDRWDDYDLAVGVEQLAGDVRDAIAVFLPGWSLGLVEQHPEGPDDRIRRLTLHVLHPDSRGWVDVAARRRGGS